MYAVEVQAGIAVRCIVGSAMWAAENLGGDWHDSTDKVGIGWTWDGTAFSAPYEPPPDDTTDPPPSPDPDI